MQSPVRPARGPGGRAVWRNSLNIKSRPQPCRAFGGLLSGLLGGTDVTVKDCEPELTAWLESNGLPPQKVAVQQLAGQGRGLVARQRLARGEALLQVPMGLVVSEKSALEESPILRRITGGLSYRLPAWSVLALWLAEQRWHVRSGGGSRWAPYLAVLPEVSGTVLDWRPGEVDRFLVGGTRSKARVIIDADAATWSEVEPLVRAAEADGGCPRGMFTRQAVQWGVGLLLSRSVRLDSAGGETVLVPYADFANHAVAADCFLDYDAGSGAVAVRIDRGYAPGEQVCISYGPKASSELLLSYGFMPPPGSNPHDAAFLDVALDCAPAAAAAAPAAPQQQQQRRAPQRRPAAGGKPRPPESTVLAAKRAAMAARGVPTEETFGVRLDALPEGLMQYLAYVDAPLADESEAEALAEAVLTGWGTPGAVL
ncbi:MAG: hypothetical protein J3K34DRAFT_23211 [Monoraphidium minutum]|nr:MAG: hypothetical protein J3K34DRAFT_23211 [Monoraphidium minutum]